MKAKTPEQLEDAAIADAIRSVAAIKTRAYHRQMVNDLTARVQGKVDRARLDGKKVDIQAFVKEVVGEVASYQG